MAIKQTRVVESGGGEFKDAVTPDFLKRKSQELKATCIRLAHDGKEGHLNGALSSVDILIALYYGFLNVNPQSPQDPARDRLLFSKGHACTSLYAILADRGFFPKEWLADYAKDDSPLPSHPCKHALPILEVSAGSLGHGLGVGAGIAYSHQLRSNPSRVVAVISDGECNEGSTWEAATFAAQHNLSNLVVVVDYNGVQSVGRAPQLLGDASSVEARFSAFGWDACQVDGHDIPGMIATLGKVPFQERKPSAIIARTRAGSGVSFMEDQVLWHYRVPSDEEVQKAMRELNQPTEGDFQ